VFLGEYQHSLDAKGRVVLPARWRSLVGEGCVLTIGPDTCLQGFTKLGWDGVAERLATLRIAEPGRRDAIRRVFALAHFDTPDPQGRILVPEPLRQAAGLDREIAVVGQHDHFEVWGWDAWQSRVGTQSVDDLPF